MTKRAKNEAPEYRILITPHFNERGQKFTTLFKLETVKSFSTFRYDLTVEEHVEKKTIRFKVLGLKTPQLSLPAAGHAQFVREYENLKGTYEIVVEGIDGRVSSFSVRITPQQVKLLKAPPRRSIDVMTDESLYSEN